MLAAKQGFQCRKIQISDRQIRHGQFIKSNPFHRTPKFSDQFPVGLPVGGPEAHINAGFRPLGLDPVGPQPTQENLDQQQRLVLNRYHLYIRDKSRSDGIGDQAAKPLFLIQGVDDSYKRTAFVIHTDDDPAAGRIGKSDQSFYQTFGGG